MRQRASYFNRFRTFESFPCLSTDFDQIVYSQNVLHIGYSHNRVLLDIYSGTTAYLRSHSKEYHTTVLDLEVL
jgi:hypothetical protein